MPDESRNTPPPDKSSQPSSVPRLARANGGCGLTGASARAAEGVCHRDNHRDRTSVATAAVAQPPRLRNDFARQAQTMSSTDPKPAPAPAQPAPSPRPFETEISKRGGK
jgi:hypothetical protein